MEKDMEVVLVGTGCGAPENMTIEARQALRSADLIIGARRLLEGLPDDCTENRQPAIYAAEICEMIRETLSDGKLKEGPQICVAYSGDSGFYSGTRSLLPLLKEAGIEAKVLPGISSIQVLSARLQQPWQDWTLVSAHGTECDPVTAVMGGRPVFFLTGGSLTPTELCQRLAEAGLGELPVTVAERLTYEDERILTGSAEEFAGKTFAPLSVMLAQPVTTVTGDITPGIPDDRFIRGEVPMTKRDIRAAILSHLQVGRSDTVWDVGAGTGSVSVELAMKASQGKVIAVERVPEGCRLIRENREKFGVWNLTLVEGAAPEALADLPAPDRVFIGGSGGHMREIIGIALEKNPQARICVSAIVLESMQTAIEVMAAAGLDVEVTQVSVSTARKLGSKHMMVASNPIFIITGQRAEAVNTVTPGASKKAEAGGGTVNPANAAEEEAAVPSTNAAEGGQHV